MSIIVVQVLKSLQLTPRQAIKVCAHDLVNEIHEIKTAKHFIYTVIYIGETLAHFNRLQLWICQIVHTSTSVAKTRSL